MTKLRVLDLFSGIGGFSLGLERTGGFETVAFCEIDPFCRKVLAKHWPGVPIHDDVRTLDHDGPVDVISGGYPCQPFSNAGKRQGEEDDRHLWPAMFGIIKTHRPAWVIGENVAGHIGMGLDSVLSDLESADYSVRTFVIPACAVDAPHRRDRVWIVAHNAQRERSDGGAEIPAEASERAHRGCYGEPAMGHAENVGRERRQDIKREGPTDKQKQQPCFRGEFIRSGEAVADNTRFQPRRKIERSERERAGQSGQSEPDSDDGRGGSERARREVGSEAAPSRWKPEPDVGRVANGVPRRVDRLRSLGNSVVPQIPEMIGRAILAAERDVA